MKNQISIYTEMTPNPDVMKFVSSNVITSFDIEISRSNDSKIYPLATEILIFPFVEEIYISQNFISIKKNNNIDWIDIANEMREFIQDYINNNIIINNNTKNIKITEKKKYNVSIHLFRHAFPSGNRGILATYLSSVSSLFWGFCSWP